MSSRRIALLAVAALLAPACSTTRYRADFTSPQALGSLDREAPFLKCHLTDGGVVVLRDWSVEPSRAVVTGTGVRYGARRRVRAQGRLTVPLADVVLYETNSPESVRRDNLIFLGVASGASLAMTAVCLLNPKACFGSCPTFYVRRGDDWSLAAEGFSSSIARVLESTDVDALAVVDPPAGRFVLRMTNEALETHVVRSVRVLAAPRPEGVRVLRGADGYRIARALAAPATCTASEGDCLATLATADGQERISPADPQDLGARETVELSFAGAPGPLGIAIVARNSLLNTFVFYQVLSYMGRDAGRWMAGIETMGASRLHQLLRIGASLGDLEVEVLTAGRGWVQAGAYSEIGPIARETQLIVLPEDLPDGEVRVRLRLGQGSWRLDAVQLAALGPAVEPVALSPVRASRQGRDAPEVLAALGDPARTVVTYPGDLVALEYELPPGPQELFLESRGYYYEWMRSEWLRDESPIDFARALADPEGLLRRLAPAYKRVEAQMDRIFWSTRIGRGRP